MDPRVPFDPVDQVAGHAVFQVSATDQKMDGRRLARQEQGRLAGGVAAADDRHRVEAAGPRLPDGGGVVDPETFEPFDAGGGQPPVAGAGGHHDVGGGDRAAVGEPHHAVPVPPFEAGGLGGDVDPGAEPVRLDDGAFGELHAGDPGGETEVVLDPGGGAGLAAGRHGVQDDGGESLGGAVHRGGQAPGPRADDHQVADGLLGGLGAQPDDAGEFGVRGIAQHPVVVPDDDRGLLRSDPEPHQQLLGLGVLLQIGPAVREAVAGGELQQPPGVGGEGGADDAEAGARAGQHRAAQQVGPQDHVAECGFAAEQVAQGRGTHRQHLARCSHHRAEEGGLALQQTELAEEAPRTVQLHDLFLVAVALDHGHRAAEDDEELLAGFTRPEELFALADRLDLPAGSQDRDLVVRQRRIGAVDVGCRRAHRHDSLPSVETEAEAGRALLAQTIASCTKHHRQSSPGSNDLTIGCPSVAA